MTTISAPPQAQEDVNTGLRLPAWLTETPYWAISAVLHLIIVLAIGSVILRESEAKTVRRTMTLREHAAPEKPWDPNLTRWIRPNPTEVLETREEQQLVVITDPIEPVSSDPEGDPNRHSTKNISTGVSDPIGFMGSPPGSHGTPTGQHRAREAPGQGASSDAVRAALEWLKRHQHADGHWSSHDFTRACQNPDQSCAARNPRHGSGRGFEGYDVGVTGLAMLAFLGFGHTHVNGEIREYRDVLRRAMTWMLGQQQHSEDPTRDGIYGPTNSEEWIYNHAIATMAMAESLYLSRDRFGKLPASVTAATNYILRARNDGYGWKYGYHDGRNDTSVTGWMVLALKTAKACSSSRLIKIRRDAYDDCFAGAIAWFDRTTSKLSGITGYQAPGDEGSRIRKVYPEPYPYSKNLSCMTAVSTLCRLFAGGRRRDPAIKSGVQVLMKELPRWREQKGKRRSLVNFYYWYYASYAVFQYGGREWKAWNKELLPTLLNSQRHEPYACVDGSWDPAGEWGVAGGRVYATALNAMTLEVYYRYMRVTDEAR